MPYQDIEDTDVAAPKRAPSFLGRWLRRLFVDDWAIKLLALGITLVLWLAVSDLNKPRTIRVAVQLSFVRPPNLDISNEPPRTIDVELTGSRERLNDMRLLDLIATVDLSDNTAGERFIRLTNERVHMDLPEGVRIASFKPAAIPIRLEPTLERQLPVEVKFEGEPVAGFEILSAVAEPKMISVRGPASLIQNLQQAPTELVPVTGRNGNFTAVGVTIAISDTRIDVVTPSVDVYVEIGEKRSAPSPPVSSHSDLTDHLVAQGGVRSIHPSF